jgi:LysM repeat protein
MNTPFRFSRPIILGVCLFLATVSPIVFSDVWIYSVKEGDNLWDLTVDHLKDVSYVKKVQELNNIKDPWQMLPGTEIKIPANWLRSFPILVRVRSMQGQAELIEEKTNDPSKLVSGALVIVGDTIRTGENSSVILEFVDGTRLSLEENSEMKVQYLGAYEYTGMTDSRLYLKKGRLETQVAPKKGSASRFEIATPVTVTSVRGTNYRISSDPETAISNTEVLEGGVSVSGSNITRLIPKGFGTIAATDHQPEPPIKLLEPPAIDDIPKVYERVPIQLKLPELPKNQGYRVQVAETPLFNNILFNKPFSSSMIRTIDLPDGKYQMRVRGIDVQGLEGENVEFQFELNARPEPPFMGEPKPGAGVLEETPTFKWSQDKAAKGYHLQISKTEDFAEILVDTSSRSTDSSLTIEKPLKIGKYYWRMATIDQDGDGPFSDPLLLRRIPPAPKMEAPEMTDDTLVLNFRKGLPGQKYEMQMAKDEAFTRLVIDKQLEEPILEEPLPESGEYFIRIRTIDSDGFIGPFSAPQIIEVPGFDWYLFLALLPLFALFAL